jgi:hypothetical protein
VADSPTGAQVVVQLPVSQFFTFMWCTHSLTPARCVLSEAYCKAMFTSFFTCLRSCCF